MSYMYIFMSDEAKESRPYLRRGSTQSPELNSNYAAGLSSSKSLWTVENYSHDSDTFESSSRESPFSRTSVTSQDRALDESIFPG